jgi:hypothetical protein
MGEHRWTRIVEWIMKNGWLFTGGGGDILYEGC